MWHDSCWHARLLSICYLGIRLGVYQTHWECPFWTSGETGGQPAAGEEDDEEAKDRAAAAAVPAQAASSSNAPPPQQP
eukprot:4186927-Lingulodinium_polyedra.AAC.1